MRQPRLMSLVEAVANVLVGYGVAVLTQVLVFPLFGLRQNLAIGAIFTLASLVRAQAVVRGDPGAALTIQPRETPASNRLEPHGSMRSRGPFTPPIFAPIFRRCPFRTEQLAVHVIAKRTALVGLLIAGSPAFADAIDGARQRVALAGARPANLINSSLK